jgi:hypothetical protein
LTPGLLQGGSTGGQQQTLPAPLGCGGAVPRKRSSRPRQITQFEHLSARSQKELIVLIDDYLDDLVVKLTNWGSQGAGDAELCWRFTEFQRVMHNVQRKGIRKGFGRAKKRAYHEAIYGCSSYKSSTQNVRTFRAKHRVVPTPTSPMSQTAEAELSFISPQTNSDSGSPA